MYTNSFCVHFLLPSCQFNTSTRPALSKPDMFFGFCLEMHPIPIVSKCITSTVKKSSQKIWAAYVICKKTSQLPNWLKFAQSGPSTAYLLLYTCMYICFQRVFYPFIGRATVEESRNKLKHFRYLPHFLCDVSRNRGLDPIVPPHNILLHLKW
jgi:hypothetical protein